MQYGTRRFKKSVGYILACCEKPIDSYEGFRGEALRKSPLTDLLIIEIIVLKQAIINKKIEQHFIIAYIRIMAYNELCIILTII
jgi:hypothetical protein